MEPEKVFERDLREYFDAMYQRPPGESNSVADIVRGQLPLEDIRTFYSSLWPSLQVFNRVLLPRLLMSAPDFQLRLEISEVIVPEFGTNVGQAHPTLFYNLLEGLGCDTDQIPFNEQLDTPEAEEEEKWLRDLSWVELLARILCGESLGPKVFEAIASSLRDNYDVSSNALAYFTIHANHDKRDTEILFSLIPKSAKTDADRKAVWNLIEHSFEKQKRYRECGCNLPGKSDYSYSRRFDRRQAS
jgi:pyrroloquinoline quinone (PQQ) biosynthesis protein C